MNGNLFGTCTKRVDFTEFLQKKEDCLYFQHCIFNYYSYQIWKSTPRVPSDTQKFPNENIRLGALLHKLLSTIWIPLTSLKYFYVSIKNCMVTKSQVPWVTKISKLQLPIQKSMVKTQCNAVEKYCKMRSHRKFRENNS